MSDNVLHPAHYAGEIETIDFIRDKLTADGFRAYCIGNVLKYISRYDKKGAPLEDLQKAQVYLGWAIESFGTAEAPTPTETITLPAMVGIGIAPNRELASLASQAEPQAEVKKPERKKPRTKATKKPGNRKELDMGKITALRDAGWSIPKIADEMGVSAPTIRKALRDLEYPDLTDGMFD